MNDLNTKLTIAIDGTQGEIERVLVEIKDLQAAMKQKVDERNTLAKSHRDQQIVQNKWLEVLQQIEVTLAQACSAFENPTVLDEKMREDVSDVFDRVLSNYAEYSQMEIKETDAIVDGKVIKDAWTPTDYIAKITGVQVAYGDEEDAWTAEAEVLEPTLTKQAVKMFLINNGGEDDIELWSYLQESIGIVNKKRTLDTVANAISEENVSIEELEEYTEEYSKKRNRKERRLGQQQLKLKAS